MVSISNRPRRLSACFIGIATVIIAVFPQGAIARDKKPTKEERRIEQMRVNLQSKSPAEYCEAVYTFRPNGFYPYCSPVTYPETQHSFTALAGIQAQKSTLVEMRLEGDRTISSKATALEKMLIDDSAATTATDVQPCLGQSPANCIAYLASRFLVTTAADIPFYDWSSQASFDPDKARNKRLALQVLVPHTDSTSYVKDYGWRDTSPPLDVVGVSAYVVDGKIKAVTLAGRYPILSENPHDYIGSGFASFAEALFPSCQFASDDEFYRSFWTALVKPQKLGSLHESNIYVRSLRTNKERCNVVEVWTGQILSRKRQQPPFPHVEQVATVGRCIGLFTLPFCSAPPGCRVAAVTRGF